LNDVEEGGETRFNQLNLDVKPRRGRAILWPSVLNEDPNVKDFRTEHEALAVTKVRTGGIVKFCFVNSEYLVPRSYLTSSLFLPSLVLSFVRSFFLLGRRSGDQVWSQCMDPSKGLCHTP
jgi:hypothetical protein